VVETSINHILIIRLLFSNNSWLIDYRSEKYYDFNCRDNLHLLTVFIIRLTILGSHMIRESIVMM